jgi:hypothetical protein
VATKAKKLDKYSGLQDILGKELPINAARVKCIVLLVTALIKVQSVNFERLAQGFHLDTQKYKGANIAQKRDKSLLVIEQFTARYDL